MASMDLSYELPEGQHRGVASPKIYNMAVESVVHHWISLTVEDDSATHEGLGMEVGRCIRTFDADDGMIVLRDP